MAETRVGELRIFSMDLGLRWERALERRTLAPSWSLMLDLASLVREHFHSRGS